MRKTYVLDASAILDFVENGPGASKVEELMLEAMEINSPLLISLVNWGEVFYHVFQKHGEETARSTITNLSRLAIQLIDVDQSQALEAGEIKARHKLPYVDCLAASLAMLRQSVLVTADRHFEALGRHAKLLWLPRP